MASLGESFGTILCVSRTSLLCIGSITVGKSNHLFYCNHIACMMYNESLENPVLDFFESGKEFTEVGGVGVGITSLGNCFAEYVHSLIGGELIIVEEMYASSPCFTVVLKTGESTKPVNDFILTFLTTWLQLPSPCLAPILVEFYQFCCSILVL